MLLVFIVFLVKAIFYTHNPNSASKSILFFCHKTPSHWLSVCLIPSVFKTIIVVTFKFYLSIYVQASSSQENQSEQPNKQIKKNTLTSSFCQRTRKEFSLFFEDAITFHNNFFFWILNSDYWTLFKHPQKSNLPTRV